MLAKIGARNFSTEFTLAVGSGEKAEITGNRDSLGYFVVTGTGV